MKERQLRSAALAMILLIFFSWASWEIFRHQNSDYIKWYVQNGSTIALIMGLVSLAIDLDRLPGLISLRPDIFIATAVKVVSLPISALVTSYIPTGWRVTVPKTQQSGSQPGELKDPLAVRSMDEMASRESDEVVGRIYVLGASREPPRFYLISQRWEGEAKLFSLQESWSDQRGEMRLLVTDREGSELILRPDFSYMRRFVMGPYAVSRAGCLADIVAFPIIVALSIVITGGFVAWFVALAPLQYATFAICGTLSRRLLRYPMTYGYDAEVERVQVYPLAESDVPKQIAAVQFRLKPVTTTLAVSALVLWLLSLIQ